MAEKDELKKLIKEVESLQEQIRKAESQGAAKGFIDEMKESLKEANQYYKDNKSEIEDTNGELKTQLKQLEQTGTSLQAMILLNKGITQTFTDMSKESTKFARSTDAWFNKGEQLAEQYLKVSRNIGLSENRSRTLTTNFNNSVKESLALGYSLEDLRETFDIFAEETGRARILSSEEVKNIAKVAEGANLYATEATKMAEQFDLMGVSSEKMVNLLNESIRTSREMGLNSNKVIKVLQQNMGIMQQYSFSRGVKGMVEMSKLSVKMRMEVSDMLSMADKFYQPEAAIEAAANLQLLGGDIAKAFGDPFTVMYEARNKPEELAKRVGKMTENMVSFNEETGEFDFPPEARMQLQAVSKELGIGMDSLTEMTRQASKIKSIKMNVSGNVLDENLREGIAGMARMKDGKWKVDFEEGGQTITRSIDDLTNEQAKLVLDQEKEFSDKTEKDFLSEIALNTQTFSEKIKNIGDSQQYGFAAEMDVYSVTMDAFLKDGIDSYRRESQSMMEALTKSFGEDGEGLRVVLRDAFVGKGTEGILEEGFRTLFSNMEVAITKSIGSDGKLDARKFASNSLDVDVPEEDFILRSSGQVTSFTNEDDIIGAKRGGPLDKLMDKGLPNNMMAGTTPSKVEFGNINISGRIEIVSPDGSTNNMDMSSLKPQIEKMIINHMNGTFRDGGISSSKQATDYMG